MIANFCFVCDRELELVFPQSQYAPAQCKQSVMFAASGTYGSEVFDPISSRNELLINICDGCLKAKKDRVLVVTTEKPRPVVSYEPWNPEELY